MIGLQKGGIGSNMYREMFMSEIDTNQRPAKAGNRPTMATGMLEENSSIQDGHPEFELIGSDFLPSQKAGGQSQYINEAVSSTKVNDLETISQVKKLTPVIQS